MRTCATSSLVALLAACGSPGGGATSTDAAAAEEAADTSDYDQRVLAQARAEGIPIPPSTKVEATTGLQPGMTGPAVIAMTSRLPIAEVEAWYVRTLPTAGFAPPVTGRSGDKRGLTTQFKGREVRILLVPNGADETTVSVTYSR